MVTVIGLGFVGLTTALGFAELGNQVWGFDINKARLNGLRRGKIGFVEPRLEEMLASHVNNRFFLVDDLTAAVEKSEVIFICAGTPCSERGAVDLRQIISAVNSVLEALPLDHQRRVIAVKSTVPPGTCEDVLKPLARNYNLSDEEVSFVSNPEFLREGCCWEDFMNPSRIVIGTKDQASAQILSSYYSKLDAPVHIVSPQCAEFAKYLSNVMLATMISFSNELAYAAEIFGDIDIIEAFHTLHDDDRVKGGGIASYLYPGCGFGGYCLPKDLKAFSSALKERGYSSNLLNGVLQINDDVVERLCDRVAAQMRPGYSVGVLGLAFKPGTDDVRETPAARIIAGLRKRKVEKILAYDPLAAENFCISYPELGLRCVASAEALVSEASIIVIATAWEEFKTLDLSGKKLVDGRYMIRGGAE